MKIKKMLMTGLLLSTMTLVACSNSSESIESSKSGETSTSDTNIVDNESSIKNYANKNYVEYANLTSIKSTKGLGGDAEKYYTKYVEYLAANGKSIKILAQDKVNDEQLLYAHSILNLYLTNLTKVYGEDIANKIANSGDYLVMPNGSDGDVNEKTVIGQPQYQNETANVGSKWYIENDYEHRDSAYEEIFHFVHNSGVGTIDRNSESNDSSFGSKELAQMINDGKNNALPKDKKDWGKKGIWGLNAKESLEEWAGEAGSLEAEYIICVIDTYYGNWEASDTTALFGEYKGKTREDLKTIDPKGLEIVKSFLPQHMNVMYRLDPSFEGTFKMYRDDNDKYTYKSQYLDMITLTGDKNTNIIANDNDNILIPNKGKNKIDGLGGKDIVQFSGESTEYTITKDGDNYIVTDQKDRDGENTLTNIEILRFTDIDKSL